MIIDSDTKKDYLVLRVQEKLTPSSPIIELRNRVRKELDNGITKIAIRFAEGSLFCSSVLGAIAECMKMANVKGEKIAIIAPDKELLELLAILGFSNHMIIFPSEESIC